MFVKKNISIIFLLLGFCSIILIFFNLELPDDTHLWREIHNTGHTPLFGMLSLLFLSLSSLILGKRLLKQYFHYLIALVLTVLMGAITELIQIYGPGDADISDLIRDILGAVSFLGLYVVFNPKMIVFWRKRNNIRIFTFVSAFLLLFLSIIPVSMWAWAYHQRNQAFPQILGFESSLENKFTRTNNAELVKTHPPAGWKNPNSRHVGQLTLFRDTYPGFSLEEPFPNWTAYRYMSFFVYSELNTTVNLTMRIEDIHHNNFYDDRFNYSIIINPGLNQISIPLEKVKNAPSYREMDMTAIYAIYFFVVRPGKPFILYFDDLRLE